jgi:hypothetical protein
MAVTTITNRGTLTATLIQRLPERSASSARRVKADSLGLRVKVKTNRVRHARHATRIKLVPRDHGVSLARHKIKRCLPVNPVASRWPTRKMAACPTLMRKRPHPLARRAFLARRASLALHVRNASHVQHTPPANRPHKSLIG